MSKAIAGAGVRYTAPPLLRRRIVLSPQPVAAPSRRTSGARATLRWLGGIDTIAATGLVAIVLRDDDAERIQSRWSLHISALAAGWTSDRRVVSTDQSAR